MNTFNITLFIIFALVFGIFIFSNQKSTPFSNPLSTLPTLSQNVLQTTSQNTQQTAANNPNSQPTVIPTTASVAGPLAASISAVIKTSKGDITLTLFGKDAPNTVQNFITKAQSGYYVNLTFHRVEDWVVQGGDPKGDGTGGGDMPVEFNSDPFIIGSLGMASHGDGKVQNDSQFFITKTAADWLNNQYTNFGTVTEGMDVVNKIAIGDKILGITINQ